MKKDAQDLKKYILYLEKRLEAMNDQLRRERQLNQELQNTLSRLNHAKR